MALVTGCILGGATGCRPGSDPRVVVVYTALDQIYSEPILRSFEDRTGIRVLPVYDIEATKTVGLVNRILAEGSHPRCDVFWNNEVVRTVVLKRKGLLESYRSPSASDIPDGMKDPDGTWSGFAARARVLIENTNLVPRVNGAISLLSLVEPEWKGRVSMPYPLFGTTSSQAAALYRVLGKDRARSFFEGLRRNGVLIVDGNAASKDAVVRGEAAVGFTDTDDALVAVRQGGPVRMVFPDQADGQMGTLVIPNTVAILRNCPHPVEARQLVDFLLSREVERTLAECGSAQMPVRPGLPAPQGVPPLKDIRAMKADWDRMADGVEAVAAELEDLFLR